MIDYDGQTPVFRERKYEYTSSDNSNRLRSFLRAGSSPVVGLRAWRARGGLQEPLCVPALYLVEGLLVFFAGVENE
jgi:hypothetical protein